MCHGRRSVSAVTPPLSVSPAQRLLISRASSIDQYAPVAATGLPPVSSRFSAPASHLLISRAGSSFGNQLQRIKAPDFDRLFDRSLLVCFAQHVPASCTLPVYVCFESACTWPVSASRLTCLPSVPDLGLSDPLCACVWRLKEFLPAATCCSWILTQNREAWQDVVLTLWRHSNLLWCNRCSPWSFWRI